MSNLNSDPSTRTRGSSPLKEFQMQARTINNLTDQKCPRCHKFIIGDTCLCEFVKPVVKNKAGKPYDTTWHSNGTAFVFHPGELEYAIVDVTFDGLTTCKGYSNDERCWQFYNKATCNHCDAVALSIELGERPAPIVKKKPTIQLEDLYSWVDEVA